MSDLNTRLHAAASLACSLCVVTLVTAQPAPPTESVADVLQKAGAYTVQFREAFSTVVGIERSDQTIRRSLVHRGPKLRRIESEVFLASVGEPATFMTVRSVSRVDGRAIPGAHDRVIDALSSRSPISRQERLRTLAGEGARYNLGAVGRTFNDPTLALMFLSPELRGRFAFTLDTSRERAQGGRQRLTFRETARPSLIRDERDGIDADISGFIDMTDEGQVDETELSVVIQKRVTATVHVRYRYEPSLRMRVPTLMTEDYRNEDGPTLGLTLITCTARYSDYRRFDTSVRILPQ